MKSSVRLIGGLGNNLFQISALLAFSMKHNIDYCIPVKVESPHYPNQKVFYSKNLKYCTGEDFIAQMYNEKSFEYHEIPAPTGNIILNGYWQSNLFFQDYRDEILRILDIPYEFNEGWCSIHVRRGDYVKYPNAHPLLDVEYFHNAIIEMIDKTDIIKFLVVSDDMQWCKDNLKHFVHLGKGTEYVFSEGKTDVEDLSLASSCEHSIGSNSSFSVWVYWLNQNKNKIGVFPAKDKWFGKDLKHNVDDLYMPEWVLI